MYMMKWLTHRHGLLVAILHPHAHNGTWWIVDNSVHTSPHGETVGIGGFVYNFVDNLGHYPPVIPTLSPTYPHGYPQIVENYAGVVCRSPSIGGKVSIFAQSLSKILND